jgi:flagellar motor switch/type III secretory pathway protein FliN
MNMSATFTPARALARHCAELTERGPRPEERAAHLAAWRRDVARELATDLGELLAGTKLAVTLGEPEAMTGRAVFDALGPVAANCLLRCGSGDQTALLSFEIATAIALTDRSFGGSGEPVLDRVETLPRSAGLLVEQAARIIAQAIARVSAAGGLAEGDVIVRSESAQRLKPFGPEAGCMVMRIDMSTPDGQSWCARLALAAARLDSLLPGLGGAGGKQRTGATDDGLRAAVLGTIPLPLEAVLAEFDLSLARLEQLVPGERIPLALGRDIPLRVGARTVAHGSIGTLDDRLALRLTSIVQQGLAA